MRLSPLLPTQLRVRLNAARSGLAELMDGGAREDRPVFRSLHTQAELKALSEEAGRAQAAARARAGAGRRQDVDARIRELEVVEVRRPTADSVTLAFSNPEADPIRFSPGQFMTLMLNIEGEELRRAYSFMGDPADASRVEITIKKVAGGRASSWLCDHAAPGMRIRALGPSGSFGTRPDPSASRRVILIAGGSGITPLYAIARALTAQEPDSRVALVYGNRRREDVIFRAELDALAAARPAFEVSHVLEEAHRGFKGHVGRLSGEVLAAAVPVDAAAEYYICGPDPMMEGAIAYLVGAGVPEGRVHMERFTAPAQRGPAPSTGAVWSVQFAKSGALLQARDDMTLLEAGLAAGIPMEYSCTFGGCGACKVRLIEGDVELEEPNCLTQAERQQGEILACVARARSAVVLDR